MSGFGAFVIILFLAAVAVFAAILAYCSVVDGGTTHATDDSQSNSTNTSG